MPHAKYIRWFEIARLAPSLNSNQWYSLLARNKVPGVERRPDGWGYQIPRKAFLAWLDKNPRYKQVVVPAQPKGLTK